ncbi:hypothetical protein ACF0H5_002775 [Mactra antiquata]
MKMMLIARASYHQANPRYYGARRQCVANSYTAVQKARNSNVKNWTETDLNDIRYEGNSVYTTKWIASRFSLISDLQTIDKKCVLIMLTWV